MKSEYNICPICDNKLIHTIPAPITYNSKYHCANKHYQYYQYYTYIDNNFTIIFNSEHYEFAYYSDEDVFYIFKLKVDDGMPYITNLKNLSPDFKNLQILDNKISNLIPFL